MAIEPGEGPGGDVQSLTGPSLHLQWEHDSRCLRILDPPIQVTVAMRSIDPDAFQPIYASSPAPSLRVRASGIRFEPSEPGWLMAWIRLADGQWRAIVSVTLRSANRRTVVQMPIYVRPGALKRRDSQ